MDSIAVLEKLAKRFDKRLERVELYDANVCDWRQDRESWELVLLSGEPFSRKLRFVYKARTTRFFANRIFINGSVAGSFECGVLCINGQLRAVGSKTLYAGTASAGSSQYPVFTQDGHLSPDQKRIISLPQLSSLLGREPLGEEEKLFLTADEIGFYLKQPDLDRVARMLEGVSEVASAVGKATEPRLNLGSLPAKFRPLFPAIEMWAEFDDEDREEMLSAASDKALEDLTAQVNPYLVAIDEYLDSFGDRLPPGAATALGKLAECAVEAKVALERRKVG
jgi:hypothetical protein